MPGRLRGWGKGALLSAAIAALLLASGAAAASAAAAGTLDRIAQTKSDPHRLSRRCPAVFLYG